jgi:two-component system response regulator MprA
MRDHVLIVDDDPFMRRFLRRALVQAAYDVSAAATGCEGLTLAQQDRPAIVLLDVMLPDLDGVTVCQRLRVISNAIIIMLTAKTDTHTRVDSLDLGADDYVTKPFEVSELLARMRAQLRRYRADGARRLRLADVEIDPLQRTARRGQRSLALTSKEFEIFLLFIRNPGRVFDQSSICHEVWSEPSEELSKALKVHLHNLRSKLNGPGEPPLLHTVRGAGYVLREPLADIVSD